MSEKAEDPKPPEPEKPEGPGKPSDPPETKGQQKNAQDADYWKKRAEKAELKQKDLERASLSELDRTKAERDDWKTKAEAAEARVSENNLRSAFFSKAVAAGIRDPEDAFRLADQTKMALSEDGDLVGADAALVSLKKNKPYLFLDDGELGSKGGRGKGNGGPSISEIMNEKIRRQAFGG